jgi:3-oxoacyl-[acyl-carrier-protein] synthase III
MTAAIARLLQQAGLTQQDIAWWSPASAGAAGDIEAEAAEAALRCASVTLPCIAERFGHAGGASVALQLAACLAMAPEGIGLLTGSDSAGQFGCALLRRNTSTIH